MLIKKADLYFAGLSLMAIGLPVSEFLMSLSYMIIALAWLIDGPKKKQWNDFKSNKLAWAGVSLFLIPFVTLLWTSDYDYALHDLRIKLPLLLVPFLISSYSISQKQFYILLGLLIGSTFVGSVILYINYYLNLDGKLVNLRDVSIFISHIRFSLIIDICIFILFYAAIRWKNIYSLIATGMAMWFVYFIFFLGSGNGFVGLLTVLVFSIILLLKKSPYRKLSYGVLALFIGFTSYIIYLGQAAYRSHYVVKKEHYNDFKPIKAEEITFYSLPNNNQLENGYYIWRNVSNPEIIKEWRAIGDSSYYEMDKKGQPILGTLIRYLTSKALSKDSVGIHQLNESDIINIQNGDYHYKQHQWNNLQFRIDQFFYQIMAFNIQEDPGNKPFVQRYYYWKGAFSIIKQYPLFGVGAGDIQHSLTTYFKNEASELGSEYRHHTHNQYLSYFIISGVFGFLLFLWAVFYPLKLSKQNEILMFAQLILLISFISEDTLETQPGVTLYVLFLALAIALYKGNSINQKTEYP